MGRTRTTLSEIPQDCAIAQKKGGGSNSVPFRVDKSTLLWLQELPHKKLADLLRAFDRLAVDYQHGHSLGTSQLDQLFFMLRLFANVFLHDLLFAMEVGHTVEHALAKTAFVVEIKLHRHG